MSSRDSSRELKPKSSFAQGFPIPYHSQQVKLKPILPTVYRSWPLKALLSENGSINVHIPDGFCFFTLGFLTFTFAKCRKSVCLSVVTLSSLCNVRAPYSGN